MNLQTLKEQISKKQLDSFYEQETSILIYTQDGR